MFCLRIAKHAAEARSCRFSPLPARRGAGSASFAEVSQMAWRGRIRERCGHDFQHALQIVAMPNPGPSAPSSSGFDQSDNHLGRIEIILAAQPIAFAARAINAVERKRARLQLRNVDAAIRTGHASRSKAALRRPRPQPAPGRCASFIAVATDCSSRFSIPGFTSRRSTTTSMVWFLRLSSWISSVFVQVAAVRHRYVRAQNLLRQLVQLLLELAFAAAHHRRQHHHAVFRLQLPSPVARSAPPSAGEIGLPHCGQCGTPIDE